MNSLTSTNKYGESAVEDIERLVCRFQGYLGKRGAELGVNPDRLVEHILQYIYLRQKSGVSGISAPRTPPVKPVGWTDADEEIWRDWMTNHCTMEGWRAEVRAPIFGTDERLWEGSCEGWRDELTLFFPWWIQRSLDIVHKYDPTQLEEEVEEDNGMIDSYILDHGSAKQRKAALRGGY
jgi:hypothetical protein